MNRHGLRLLGWAVHVAFVAAWIHVAAVMDQQLHEDPRPAPRSTEAS